MPMNLKEKYERFISSGQGGKFLSLSESEMYVIFTDLVFTNLVFLAFLPAYLIWFVLGLQQLSVVSVFLL